ncbi:hypothetical protein AND_004114 [Anopheles darlingi]|uniref:RING-type E3 ubiquitin transferase n=1 Tax=Anopheles darlingi TaxID=43151 RepID=W5JML9_ANODA|nr:hypothetical protein AND_004114 [Anopheles darlingi]
MSNDVSRRKSTSSVPPSEKSDSSDADSVYSLPIEANSSRKHHRQQQQSQQQQQQQKPSKKQQLPNNTSHQQRQQQQSGGSASATATPQSYAEIARIPNMTTYEKSGMDIGSGGGGTTASAGTGGSGWPTVAEGSSQSKDGGSAGSSNVLQDLNSSEAFPQLVESHQYQAPPPSHYLSNQHQQPLLSSQPLLALPSAVSANNPSNSGTTVPYQAQIVAPRATYSQSLLTAVVSTNGTGEEPSIISTSASGKTTGSATGAIINTVVSTATNEIHNGPVTTNNASEGGIGGATKGSLHKSKSVDNNEIYYSNEHYPALERTIKGYGQTTLPSGLSCNKATNAKGTSAATSVPIAGLSFGQVAAAAPPAPLASGTAASPPATTPSVTNSTSATVTVNSAPQSQPVNTVAAKKGKAKKETTVTIVPTEGTDTSVAFAGTIATVQSSVAGNTSSNNMPNDSDTQSPTILPFDTRRAMNDAEPPAGLSSIQFMQAPQQQQSSEKLVAQQQQHVLQGGGKRNKKDKQSNITAASGASSGAGKGSSGRSSTSTASNSASNHLQPNRPAVIMMNDGVEQKSNEFTFGFSNDYELLFGDFSEEDCRKLLEGSTADSSAATSSSQKPKGQKPNSRVSSVPVTSCNIDGSDREPSLSPSSSSAVMNETRNSSSTSSTSCNSLGKPPLQQSSSSPSSSSSVCSSSSSSSNAPSYQKLPLLPSLVATPPQLYLGAHGNIVPAADSAAIETTVATVVSSTTVMPPLLTDPGTATNLFSHPPPAVLVHSIYTQPPPSLPALPCHNQFALPPPAVVAATAAASSGVQPIPVVPPGSASTTVAVVNAVPPPPAATVQVVKEGLLPGAPPTPTLVAVPSAAHLMVPPPALPPMATAVLLQPQAVVVPVVPTGSAASIADVANNNVLVATVPSSSLPHHHQQTVMTTRPQAATVGGGLQNHNNNVATNSVTQTYHASQQQQQQLQLQQTTAEVTNSAATITPVSPTSQMVTTVEASAQTINSNNAAGIQEPKGGTTVAPVTSGASATPIPVRLDKKKELNLRFVEPEQVHSIDYNHDKIVFFVGTAWEDAICGSNGTAKYYEGQ